MCGISSNSIYTAAWYLEVSRLNRLYCVPSTDANKRRKHKTACTTYNTLDRISDEKRKIESINFGGRNWKRETLLRPG